LPRLRVWKLRSGEIPSLGAEGGGGERWGGPGGPVKQGFSSRSVVFRGGMGPGASPKKLPEKSKTRERGPPGAKTGTGSPMCLKSQGFGGKVSRRPEPLFGAKSGQLGAKLRAAAGAGMFGRRGPPHFGNSGKQTIKQLAGGTGLFVATTAWGAGRP